MTADERLALILNQAKWANKQFADLQAELDAFLKSGPYKVGTKRDPETGRLVYYVTSVRETPITIALRAGQVVHELRGTLDHLAYQLLLVNGVPESDTHLFDFPIGRDLHSYQSQRGKLKGFRTSKGRVVKGMRQDAIDAIDAVEPYVGGKGALLWTLHDLDNVKKHRTILTAGSSFRSVDLGRHLIKGLRETVRSLGDDGFQIPDDFEMPIFYRPAESGFPLKAGYELLILGAEDEPDEKQQFRFEVAFAESNVVEGKPIIPFLQEATDLINGIIMTFYKAGLLA
jgi:hypothetical protein